MPYRYPANAITYIECEAVGDEEKQGVE